MAAENTLFYILDMQPVWKTQKHAANKREQTNKEASGARTQSKQSNTETTAREQRGGAHARTKHTHAKTCTRARARVRVQRETHRKQTSKQDKHAAKTKQRGTRAEQLEQDRAEEEKKTARRKKHQEEIGDARH